MCVVCGPRLFLSSLFICVSIVYVGILSGTGFCDAVFYLLFGLSIMALRKTRRLPPVLKTIFHQCVIAYTCSQSNLDGSVFGSSP